MAEILHDRRSWQSRQISTLLSDNQNQFAKEITAQVQEKWTVTHRDPNRCKWGSDGMDDVLHFGPGHKNRKILLFLEEKVTLASNDQPV